MKKFSQIRVIMLIFLGVPVILPEANAASFVLSKVPGELLTDSAALIYMREEEKLARDVYTYLFEKWELPVFQNISKSEQVHMDRVLDLINLYHLEDPALPGYGKFRNKEIQELYNSLISQGDSSLAGALAAGATIEEMDISDLQRILATTRDENITCVFTNLVRASRNHLRAFHRHLEFRKIDYNPKYLDPTEYDAIIIGTHEAGGSPCGFCAASKNCRKKE